MGRTKQTSRNNCNDMEGRASPPRKLFPYPGARAEALMGNDIRIIDHEICDCSPYHDVIHPVVIRRILNDGKIECEVPAFSADDEWFIDTFEAKHVYQRRGAEPLLFYKNDPIDFFCVDREEDNGEHVWVRGFVLEENDYQYKIRHFNWNTKKYEAFRWVDKKLCRSSDSRPGKY